MSLDDGAARMLVLGKLTSVDDGYWIEWSLASEEIEQHVTLSNGPAIAD